MNYPQLHRVWLIFSIVERNPLKPIFQLFLKIRYIKWCLQYLSHILRNKFGFMRYYNINSLLPFFGFFVFDVWFFFSISSPLCHLMMALKSIDELFNHITWKVAFKFEFFCNSLKHYIIHLKTLGFHNKYSLIVHAQLF